MRLGASVLSHSGDPHLVGPTSGTRGEEPVHQWRSGHYGVTCRSDPDECGSSEFRGEPTHVSTCLPTHLSTSGVGDLLVITLWKNNPRTLPIFTGDISCHGRTTIVKFVKDGRGWMDCGSGSL